jgi:hypothetical protein
MNKQILKINLGASRESQKQQDLLREPNVLKKHILANKNIGNMQMNKLLLSFLLLTTSAISQTIIRYDYMETWTWPGLWNTAANTGWYTNASVSSNQSAVLIGGGNGTSVIEDNWYRLPNVTGLDATKQYQFRFRLASYTFSNSTATSRGVDIPDYVSVQVSTNGGSYVNELRITGNTNSTWPYNTTGTITHTANGVFSTSAAPTGDVYQSGVGVLTNGPSVIILNLPTGITSAAFDIYCRVNSAGEEWWLDNIELWDMTPVGLPVELVSFEGTNVVYQNLITWSTASEHNSSQFLLQRSITGQFTENDIIYTVAAAGNSNALINYNFSDTEYTNTINYYRLIQMDIDGNFKIYKPIAINNTYKPKQVVKLINIMGQEVELNDIPSNGIYIEVYEDGTMRKTMK